VWVTKYRYKVLRGALQRRVRDIIAQVAEEFGVRIMSDVVSSDHVHIFVSIPPHVRESDFVKAMKGRSSMKVQQEFKQRFRANNYFEIRLLCNTELKNTSTFSLI
jgi:putative transposase